MADLKERTRWEPAEAEAEIFARWLESGLLHPEPEGTAEENYSIAIPPPNVTGALHMGHAGIATQRQVEKLLSSEGTTREAIGRAAFIERVWQWRKEFGGTIVGQFQRLGASLDYAEERFTLDAPYVRAV